MKKNGISIRFILIVLISLLVFILGLSLIYLNFTANYTVDNVKQRLENSFIQKIDPFEDELFELSASMLETLQTNTNIETICNSEDIHTVNVALRKLGDELLLEQAKSDYSPDFLFWYPEKNYQTHCFLSQSERYTDSTIIMDYFINTPLYSLGWLSSNKWTVASFNGRIYYLKAYHYRGRYLFSWVSASTLIEKLESSFLADDIIVILDSDYHPINSIEQKIISDFPKQNINLYREISRTNSIVLISYKPILNFTEISYPIIFVSIISLVLIILAGSAIFYFEYSVRRPLKEMNERLSDFSKIKTSHSSIKEVNEAMDAFSDLECQLENLKIDMYEERLQHSKAELQFYQLQIQPHFFVNCFSIMYAMAQKKNFMGIQKLCLKLSSYVRYRFIDGFTEVPLRDELHQLNDYLDIQNIRHRSASSIKDNIDEKLLDCGVPPMLLHTFVENSIKYSGLKEEELQIEIDADEIITPESSLLQILITDNGMGIDKDRARRINEQESLADSNGQHIGINNIQHRLKLLYNDNWFMEIRQCEKHHGTTVEIVLPKKIIERDPIS